MEKKYQQTPSQTVGPYFAYGLTPEQYRYNHSSIVSNHLFQGASFKGERITIKGQVFDGNENPINDAMIEIRQDATLDGIGRVGTGTEPDNTFLIHTIKPSSQNGQAPHLNVTVFMRGLLSHVFTRIYFSDEEGANSKDKIFNLIPKERQHTVIAQRREINGQVFYDFDIYMQGEKETVFFDV